MHLSAEILENICITEDINLMQVTITPSTTLLKVQISTTINYILLQCPSLHVAHSTTLSASVLILQIQVLIR